MTSHDAMGGAQSKSEGTEKPQNTPTAATRKPNNIFYKVLSALTYRKVVPPPQNLHKLSYSNPPKSAKSPPTAARHENSTLGRYLSSWKTPNCPTATILLSAEADSIDG